MPLFRKPDVRKLTARRDVAGLRKALGYQRDWRVRCAAAEALAQADVHDVEPLLALLRDPDRGARKAAAVALGRLHWQHNGAQPGADSAAAGEQAKRAQVAIPAVEPLIAVLGDADAEVRAAAALSLGRTRDASAVGPLISALTDHEDAVVHAAANALGRIGDARAVEPLIAILMDSQRQARELSAGALSPVCAEAADALGWIGDARAIEPLIATLQDPNFRVREHAAEAVGRIGDARAIVPLTAALKDPDWNMREVAAAALGQIKDKRAHQTVQIVSGE